MALKDRLRKNLRYIVFSTLVSVWFVSLLAVYLPISGWVPRTYPLAVEDNLLTLFLVTAGLSSLSSLYMGLSMLGAYSRIEVMMHGVRQTQWSKSLRSTLNRLVISKMTSSRIPKRLERYALMFFNYAF
ncbi:MAG: hypothetical protein OEZ48_02340 [Candidatus Bathyarchaeota archaeon]|nr:hypothetical protein [Candidatus Bathyarchaeota archaeon]MDH5686693.1 hypothetical protein [Candidatus Bathyarchaeota archaeon]